MSSLRISVALATCNGERFLPELLANLEHQTRPPFEVVVSDDSSTDATLSVIETWAGNAPFPVRVLHNRDRLGVVGNFSKAIRACTGECIALADQDDVWEPDKLAKLVAALRATETQAVFSDAAVVDAQLHPLGYTMWERVQFNQCEQDRVAQGEAFEVLLKHRIVTGATLAFKSALRDKALPIPDGWPHDAWIAQIAASQGNLIALPELLVAYRQHEANAVGGRRRSLLKEVYKALALDRAAWYRNELTQWKTLATRLEDRAPISLREKIAHLEARASLPSARLLRIRGILRELLAGRYRRFARNLGSIAIDLLVK